MHGVPKHTRHTYKQGIWSKGTCDLYKTFPHTKLRPHSDVQSDFRLEKNCLIPTNPYLGETDWTTFLRGASRTCLKACYGTVNWGTQHVTYSISLKTRHLLRAAGLYTNFSFKILMQEIFWALFKKCFLSKTWKKILEMHPASPPKYRQDTLGIKLSNWNMSWL